VRNSVSALDFRRGYGYIPRMRLHVNGRPREVTAADHESLLTTLRERLALTGTKLACERGECGACTVLVDGEPVYACLALTHAYAGAEITTIEGLAGGPGSEALHPVQRAFIDCDAVQCGYCTPGQVLAAVALLARSPQPGNAEIAEAMAGHLCRCGTYPKIAQAIRVAASALAERAPAP
jgi:aerobic-type carbon monoxide dehydrogenase small subunit (CoxS/CutS family)